MLAMRAGRRRDRHGDHADGQGRERLQELRRAQGAQGRHAGGRTRPGAVPGRAVGFGQVDVPALHQPPRAGQRRAAVRRRRADRLPRAGGKLHEMPPREAAKQRRDIGMVFQHFNLFPHRTALENIIEAPIQVKGVEEGRGARAGPRPARAGRAVRRRPTPTRRSCRAASSSGWRSPGRWRWTPS